MGWGGVGCLAVEIDRQLRFPSRVVSSPALAAVVRLFPLPLVLRDRQLVYLGHG